VFHQLKGREVRTLLDYRIGVRAKNRSF
jgi:hypothetical protein